MACPYFEPVRVPGAQQARETLPLPLGDYWVGTCRAGVEPATEPDAALLHSFCHFGYARGRCPRFPSDDPGPDAVRFAITRVAAPSLELCYVLERDHHPFAHGSLSYSLAAGCLLPGAEGSPPPEVVARQASLTAQAIQARGK